MQQQFWSATQFAAAAQRLNAEDFARVVKLLGLIRVASAASKERAASMMREHRELRDPAELRWRIDEMIAFLEARAAH
jgi:hypothetical protein